MAVSLACSFTTLCCVALWGFTGTSDGTYMPPPHSTTKPGFPVPMDTDNPGVRKAARFGVYQYNNSSNDLFLFKEWQINKAMVQRAEIHASRGNRPHGVREEGALQPGQLSFPEEEKTPTATEHPTSASQGWTASTLHQEREPMPPELGKDWGYREELFANTKQQADKKTLEVTTASNPGRLILLRTCWGDGYSGLLLES
ncbi:Cystatin-F [Aix galericulata]|nr:Cystatin-F [Aix galericulata]